MMFGEMSRDGFIQKFNVSRETMQRLDAYAALLAKWNPAINLVSKSSLDALWGRHIADSAQVIGLARRETGHWVDIGTGGGFPGMVVAILAKETAPGLEFTFVESDLRKVTFLRTVARETGVSVKVLSERIENIPPLDADILSARALAPLKVLLEHSERHLKPDGQALFSKGATYRQEVEESLEHWAFQSEECPSITDDSAVILNLGEIRRVRPDQT